MPCPIMVTHPDTGETMNMRELAAATGLTQTTLSRRYAAGKRGRDLIAPTKPCSRKHRDSKQQQPARSPAWLLSTAPRLADFGRMSQGAA